MVNSTPLPDATHVSDSDAALVRWIREVCARELGDDPSYRWFDMSWEDPDGDPDAEILKLFRDARPDYDSDEETVLVMCHG